MKSRTQLLAIASIVLLLILHLPFLQSDPDYNLSIGRDAFTDEGLNTSQLRNYINHDYLSFDECDNLIKTPLFNLILFPPLKIFGTHLIIARLTILLVLILFLLLLTTNIYFRKLLPLLLITTLIQYYVFQYSHFSLSEMLSISFIIGGFFFLFRFLMERRNLQLFLAAFLLSAAYYSKIQFAYIIFLIPLSILLSHLLRISYSSVRVVSMSFIWLITFALVYVLIWYLPHQTIFDFVIKDESSQKFAAIAKMPRTIAFNIIHVLFNRQNWWFNSLAFFCLIIGAFLFKRNTSESFQIMFAISSLWMLIELHKLTMLYLPSRYLVSYYFAAGLMSSVVLAESMKKEIGAVAFSRVSFAILILFLVGNMYQYVKTFDGRTYQVQAINNYFSSTTKNPDQLVMGVWSANATWDCKARCIPVWKDFMNDKDVFNRFHPRAILSEPDEDESNRAFSSQGIDLQTSSDSSRTFQIGKWEVTAYWFH